MNGNYDGQHEGIVYVLAMIVILFIYVSIEIPG